MSSRRLIVLGGILIAVAGVGFLTVADELRHIGEFFAVLGILVAGICLLLAGLYPRLSSKMALQWAPLGIALGAVAGAAVDRAVLGVSLGCLSGLFLAYFRRTRLKVPARTSGRGT